MLNNKNKYLIPFAVCLLTFSACDSNESLSVDDEGKTPIELTTGIVGENPTGDRAQTRNLVTTDNPYGHAAQAFAAGTSLYMVIKSENGTTDPLYTRTIGYAQALATTPANSTVVGFASGYNRFWEDSQSPARDSKLSVYAVCVPGYYLAGTQTVDSPNGTADGTTPWTVGESTSYSNTWATNLDNATIAWPLRGASVGSQTAAFLVNQDLCFSNNVSYHSPDERLAFDTGTNKFTSGRMVFYHALTKITFKIKRGDGFTGADFAFTESGKNIVLTGFNTSGTLNMSTGEFSSIGTDAINALSLTDHRSEASPAYDYELTGLMLPGSALTSTATNEVYFTIDNNKYHIKKSELAAAIGSQTLHNGTTPALADEFKMRPGVHYVFTMTVSKKKIDKLTAAIVPWETVSATATPTNARITFLLMNNGTPQTGEANFNLYRKASVSDDISDTFVDYNWATGYTANKANLTENTTNEGIYTAHNSTSDNTIWYWPDNKTYYHFRAVMPKDHPVTTAANDYITLTAEASYTDVCWGAPFYQLSSTTDRLTYSLTTGFDNTIGTPETHQIYKAIGPTSDPVRMELFHMMSDVTIQLTTSTGDDAVDLTNATVQLSMIHPSGKVAMGNGLVTPDGTPATVPGTVDGEFKWHYGFVPQSLENVNSTSNDVILTITTTDNNRYIVDMKNVVASSYTNTLIANPYTASSGKINRWYPNFTYTYTFNLKKSGVETISATLANWEAVTADPQTVVIQ